MEELLKHKIFIMEKTRREALFTCAMSEFTKSGYKKASTNAIVSNAGISKGLLFHYFGTKNDLYIFLFKYANHIIMTEYYNRIDFATIDVFDRLKSMILLKLDLTDKYPAVFEFISSAYFEKDSVVSGRIAQDVTALYTDATHNIFDNIDRSMFKPSIDTQKAIDIMMFTLKGYSNAQISSKSTMDEYKKEYQRYISEVDGYLSVLRQAFYKEEHQ